MSVQNARPTIRTLVIGNIPERIAELELVIRRDKRFELVESGSDGASLGSLSGVPPDVCVADYFHKRSALKLAHKDITEGIELIHRLRLSHPRSKILAVGDCALRANIEAKLKINGADEYIETGSRILESEAILIGTLKRLVIPDIDKAGPNELREITRELLLLVKESQASFSYAIHRMEKLKHERDSLLERLKPYDARATMKAVLVECAVEEFQGKSARCAARVQETWVPVLLDSSLLKSQGLAPGMLFTWRVAADGTVRAEDFTPQPLPEPSKTRKARIDRLAQRFLREHEAGERKRRTR